MLTKTDIERYFIGEKQAAMVLFVIGIIAVVLAIVCFLFLRTPFYRGAAIPLVVIGLFQVYIGYSIQKSSTESRIRNVYAYDMNPYDLKEKELPGMQQAYKSITAFLVGEVVLLLAGLMLIFLFRERPEKALWLGLGAALAIQCLIMAGAEFTAQQKTKTYIEKLKAFQTR